MVVRYLPQNYMRFNQLFLRSSNLKNPVFPVLKTCRKTSESWKITNLSP